MKTLYILTRFYTRREDPNNEFRNSWGFNFALEDMTFGTSDRRIVVLHGYTERFDMGEQRMSDMGIARKIRCDIEALHFPAGEKAIIVHETDSNLLREFQQIFTDFAFSGNYSLGGSTTPKRAEFLKKIQKSIAPTRGGNSVKIRNKISFVTAFDNLWTRFVPEKSLREWYEERHHPLVDKSTVYSESCKESNHTEYYLVFWNNISGDWFCRRLKQYLDARKNGNKVCIKLVTTPARFDAALAVWENVVSVKSGKKLSKEEKMYLRDQAVEEKKEWDKNWKAVFILSETYWTHNDFEGFQHIHNIMRARGMKRPINLILASIQSRKALRKEAGVQHDLLSVSIPFIGLPQTLEGNIPFDILTQIPPERNYWWGYKHLELLDERERLERLLHDLRKLFEIRATTAFYNQVDNFIAILRAHWYILDEKSKTHVLALEKSLESSQPDANQIRGTLDELSDAIVGRIRQLGNAEDAGTLPVTLKDTHVLIVEDTKDIAAALELCFKQYFYTITVVDAGTEALRLLTVEGLKFDGLVTDLELLDADGFEDTVQGADLVEFCENTLPHIAVRVVTRLSRISMPRRLPGFNNDKVMFKHQVSPDQGSVSFLLPQADERAFMQDFFEEIKKLADLRKPIGPEKGVFGPPGDKPSPYLTRYYYELKQKNQVEFEDELSYIQELAKKYFSGRLSEHEYPKTSFARTEYNPKEDRDKWISFFWDLMLLRLLVLGEHQMSTSRKLQSRDEKLDVRYQKDAPIPSRKTIVFIEYLEVYEGLYFKLGFQAKGKDFQKEESRKNRINLVFNNLLGFSVDKTFWGEVDLVQIKDLDRDLFPHESVFLEAFNLSDYTLIGKAWPGLFDLILHELNEAVTKIQQDSYEHSKQLSELITSFSAQTTLTEFRHILECLHTSQHPAAKVAHRNIGKATWLAWENDASIPIPTEMKAYLPN